jgi:hypothetical protein
MAKKQKRHTSKKEKKFVKALIEGQTPAEAALSAGYSGKNPSQSGYQALKQIKKRAPDIMDELGLDLRALIEKHLAPKLAATEVKVFCNDGKIIESKPYPDHGIQLRAIAMAFKLRGDYAPRDPVLAAQVGVKVVVVPKELRPDRQQFYTKREEEKSEDES